MTAQQTCSFCSPKGFLLTYSSFHIQRHKATDFAKSTAKLSSIEDKFSSVQSLSRVQLFVTLWTVARETSLSITNSWSLLKLMSIDPVMPSNHLILCHPLLLLPSIFPSIRVFSDESVLCIRWPKYWSFSFSVSPSNEYSESISFRTDWFDQSKGLYQLD